MLKAQGCLPKIFAGLGYRQAAGLLDEFAKVRAINEFRDYESQLTLFADLVDSGNIGVVKSLSGGHLVVTLLQQSDTLRTKTSESAARKHFHCVAFGRVH